MKKSIAWQIDKVPLGEINNYCILNELELDTNNMEVVLMEVEDGM